MQQDIPPVPSLPPNRAVVIHLGLCCRLAPHQETQGPLHILCRQQAGSHPRCDQDILQLTPAETLLYAHTQHQLSCLPCASPHRIHAGKSSQCGGVWRTWECPRKAGSDVCLGLNHLAQVKKSQPTEAAAASTLPSPVLLPHWAPTNSLVSWGASPDRKQPQTPWSPAGLSSCLIFVWETLPTRSDFSSPFAQSFCHPANDLQLASVERCLQTPHIQPTPLLGLGAAGVTSPPLLPLEINHSSQERKPKTKG